MAYLLDSDVFMQAANLHYPFAFCPAFWDWIDREHANNKVYSISKVREEILTGTDELIGWTKSRTSLFLETNDAKTYESLALLSSWAASKYKLMAQEKFYKGADFLLVGFAHAYGHTVVTQEKHCNGEQIKIPNACTALNVECINTWDLLAKESARFVLM